MILKYLKILPVLAGTLNAPVLDTPKMAAWPYEYLNPSPQNDLAATFTDNNVTGCWNTLYTTAKGTASTTNSEVTITVSQFSAQRTVNYNDPDMFNVKGQWNMVYGWVIKIEKGANYEIETSYEYWNDIRYDIMDINTAPLYTNVQIMYYHSSNAEMEHLLNIRNDSYILQNYTPSDSYGKNFGQGINNFLFNNNVIVNTYDSTPVSLQENQEYSMDSHAFFLSDTTIFNTANTTNYYVYYVLPQFTDAYIEQPYRSTCPYKKATNFSFYVAFREQEIAYEVIDLPGLMFDVLTMPFTFISMAFNLTLFPGTPYQINISSLFLTIIGILVFIFIIKQFLKRG